MTIYNTLYISIYFISFTSIAKVQCQLGQRRNENSIESDSEFANLGNTYDGPKGKKQNKQDCWMKFNSSKLFNTLESLDNEYAAARKKFQQAIENKEFDNKMLDAMLKSRAMADRAIQLAGDPSYIPAGLSLGGYCMMRMADSVLFFHRMKLRNDTRFQVNHLKSNLENMVLTARLSLNDLHLVGTYERSITDKDPSILYYTPTFGQVEFLLKDVSYKMEGRYRLLKDKLFLEMVISEVMVNGGILMIYSNDTSHSKAISLTEKNIEDFLGRVKSDLDDWLLDYFNDYLIFLDLGDNKNNNDIQQYDKKKTLALNNYIDSALTVMIKRIGYFFASLVKLPNFSIYSVSSLKLKLKDGLLYGLPSMYRRSVATGAQKGNIRKVDVIVGFSSLKVEYKYEAVLTTGTPVLTGLLVLSADELTAHLGLTLVNNPETVDLTFDDIRQMKPEALTVEGSANKMIANFKHLLELHVTAIMTNTMLHHIKLMSTLTKCTPDLIGYVDPNDLLYEKEIKNREQKDAEESEKPAPPQDATDDNLANDTVNKNEEESENNSEPNENNDQVVENNSESNQNTDQVVENNSVSNQNTDHFVKNNSASNQNNEEGVENNSEPNQDNDQVVENTDIDPDSFNSDEKNTPYSADSHSENQDQLKKNISTPDYVFSQEETFEIQFTNASIPKKKMFLKYNEKFSLTNE